MAKKSHPLYQAVHAQGWVMRETALMAKAIVNSFMFIYQNQTYKNFFTWIWIKKHPIRSILLFLAITIFLIVIIAIISAGNDWLVLRKFSSDIQDKSITISNKTGVSAVKVAETFDAIKIYNLEDSVNMVIVEDAAMISQRRNHELLKRSEFDDIKEMADKFAQILVAWDIKQKDEAEKDLDLLSVSIINNGLNWHQFSDAMIINGPKLRTAISFTDAVTALAVGKPLLKTIPPTQAKPIPTQPVTYNWSNFSKINFSDYVKNPPAYLNQQIKFSGMVTDFLAAGDRGGDTNFIAITDYTNPTALKIIMLRIDNSSEYKKATASLNITADLVVVYGMGVISQTSTGGMMVPTIKVLRLDKCDLSAGEICADGQTQTLFP